MNKYANAFTEVYKILNCLNTEEFEKIPKKLITVIENNRNINYKYIVNDNTDLTQQEMLSETKAILFNIFVNYLSTPEQKEKINQIKYMNYERIEKQKREKYKTNIFEEKEVKNIENNEKEQNRNIMALIEVKKESFFIKILNRIRRLIRK